MIRVVYVNTSLVRRTLHTIWSDGVGMSHAPERSPIQTWAEAKYVRVAVRVAALGEPKPTWNPIRLPATIFQPVSGDRENGPRTKLAEVENEKLIQDFGGKRKLRKLTSVRAFRVRAFRVRAFRVLAERGGGHSKAKTVSA